MKNIFKKMIMAALATALIFAALPLTSAFAQGAVPNERLEQAWARQLKNYERLGKGFDDTDAFIAKIQAKIDKAAAKGKDVAALQAALDAFGTALKSGKPIYDSMSVIVKAHQGFDASGKVTDAEQAKSTVKEFHGKMQELKSAMNGTGKALREAVKAFREANKPVGAPQKDT